MKINAKIQKFMNGKYGPDQLYILLIILYFILFFINLFINSYIISIIEIIIVFITFYRFFSKNIYKRSQENQKYLRIKNKITKPFLNVKRNYKDKNHIYKKCHHCKTTLKLPLPNKRGIKHVICPECKKRNTILVLKKQKIKVIKKH